jgi:hypothetical protein
MRECGPCTLCCDVVGVRELGKPGFEACDKICADGCAIYDERPPGCRGYNCMWIQGQLRDEDRPDLVGVVCDRMNVHGVGTTVLMRGRVAPVELIDWLVSDQGEIVTLQKSPHARSIIGDPDKVRVFLERGREAITPCP